MTDPDESGRRIAQLEQDLAREQSAGMGPQMEAKFVREKIKFTLAIATRHFGEMMDENVERMADDLNGRGG